MYGKNQVCTIIKSKVTGQYNYGPKEQVGLLHLELDDKPSGLLTVEDAKEEAGRLWGATNFEVAPE